jgi:hypothetical protein
VIQDVVDLILPELNREDALAERDFFLKHGLPVPSLVLERAGLNDAIAASNRQTSSNAADASTGASGAAAARAVVYDDNVTFYLMPAVDGVAAPLPPLDKNVLRTTAAVTVMALQKFVVKKLDLKHSARDVSFRQGCASCAVC